ncbi:MAG TPA: PorV/PorQ family protein [bacterium]|nr:PorV/PorQ family protein [bacterium]
MKKGPFLAGMLLVLPFQAFGEAGYTSANFLKIGTGARAAAMADSFTAVADDPTALYWNPAGLALLSGTGLSTTHGQWLQGVTQDYLALAHKLPDAGGVGLGLTLQDTQAFHATLEDPLGNYAGTGGAVSASDWALSLAYADSLGRFLPGELMANTYAGLKVNILGQDTPSLGDTALSFDAGFLHSIPSAHLLFGLAFQNIGTDLLDHSQPFLVKAGASWYQPAAFAPGDRLTLAVDSDIHEDTGFQPSFGAEYRTPLTQDLAGALRTGVRTTDDLQGFSAMTFGAGLQKDFGDLAAGLDYAFVPYGAIGATHRFTLNISLPQGGSPAGRQDLSAPAQGVPPAGSVPMVGPAQASPGMDELRYSAQNKNPSNNQLEMGRQAMDAGKLDDARRILQEALDQDPSNTTARQLLGNCLVKMGRLDEAQKLFQP